MTEGEPWLFRYVDDPADETAKKLGLPPPLRPAVALRLSDKRSAPRVLALVDSGSERTLAAPGLARAIGVDLDGAVKTTIGIGGKWRTISVAEVTLQLYREVLNDDEAPLAEWRADVGFFSDWTPTWPALLGRLGFFDRFTVTMHGGIPAFVVEPYELFDERFGVQIETAEVAQPRFRP